MFTLVVNASESVDRILIHAKDQASEAGKNKTCIKALKLIEENRWALQKALSNHTMKLGRYDASGRS